MTACVVVPARPVANVVIPRRRPPPYAAMMMALCGRVEHEWTDVGTELAGFELIRLPGPRERRNWKLIGLPPFRVLREIRGGNMVDRAELELDRGSPRPICDALTLDSNEAAFSTDGCTRQDDDSTHVVEVFMRDGHPWMSCTL